MVSCGATRLALGELHRESETRVAVDARRSSPALMVEKSIARMKL